MNIMFSIHSNSTIFPPRDNPKDRPFYNISKEQLEKMVTYIVSEEKELIRQGSIPNYKEDDEDGKYIVLHSIEDMDQVETTHGLEQDQLAQRELLPPIMNKSTNRNDNQCIEIPIVNIDTPETHRNDQNKQKIVDESMATYKINRKKYHQFCQNQAKKQQQARKQRKKQKNLGRKGQDSTEKRSGKAKTWKAQATSTKKILSSSNSSQKPQKQSKDAMTIIDKQTIPSMYHLSPAQTNCIGYSLTPNEDPFFQGVYEAIKIDMQYARIFKLRQSNLSKIRTFIVRRILDDFVAQRHQDSPQQRQHLARHNRRITRLDRNRYLQAGISEPPSRMKSHYLQQIFNNQPFSDYYIKYLSSDRLKNYMETSNQEMTEKFWQELLVISRKENLSANEKVSLFKEIKRKPLFYSQITEYLQEANMIMIEYSKIPSPLKQ